MIDRSRSEGRRARTPIPAIAVVAVTLALVAAACGGGSSPVPSAGPEDSTAPSAGTSVEPSAPAEPSEGASAEPGEDFTTAAQKLNELDSYKFEVELTSSSAVGGQMTSEGTTKLSGTVINAPEKASSLSMVTLDPLGNVTDATDFVLIGADAWIRSGGEGAAWERVPADQATFMTAVIDAFRPEQMFSTYFAPVGADNSRVGDEEKNGIASTHYRGGESVGLILGAIAGVQGSWASDIWIARDGGYLVSSTAGVEAATASGGGSFQIQVDITDVESPDNRVEPPI